MVRAVLLKLVVSYRLGYCPPGCWGFQSIFRLLSKGTFSCPESAGRQHSLFPRSLALHLVLCTCGVYSRSWSAPVKSQQGSLCRGNATTFSPALAALTGQVCLAVPRSWRGCEQPVCRIWSKGSPSQGTESALRCWGQHLWDKEDIAIKIGPSGKHSTHHHCSHSGVTKVCHCLCRFGQYSGYCMMQKTLPLGDGFSHVIIFWWPVPYPLAMMDSRYLCPLSQAAMWHPPCYKMHWCLCFCKLYWLLQTWHWWRAVSSCLV